MKILIGLVGVGAAVMLSKGYYRFCKDLAGTFLSQEASLKKSIQGGGDGAQGCFDLECGFEANHRLGYREVDKEVKNKNTHEAIGELL